MTPPFLLTKKALTVAAVVVAAITWLIAHATKIVIPLGISKEDALAGLGSIGAGLGILGASPLPGGTLLKGADTVRSQIATQADQIASSAKTLVLFLALASMAALSACATTGGPDGGATGPAVSVPVQIAADCGAPVLRDEATHLVDDVASALETSGDWQGALKALGQAQYDRLKADTWPAIKCAVGAVLAQTDAQLDARLMMDQDAVTLTVRRHDRAAQWMSEHPAPATN